MLTDYEKMEKALDNGLISEYEILDRKIKALEVESRELKSKHVWGMWDNWRRFIKLDIKINDLKIQLLEADNRLYKESLEVYKDY